jgi:hypothetical protein
VIETYLALAGSFVLCTRHHVLDDAALQWNDRQVPRAHALESSARARARCCCGGADYACAAPCATATRERLAFGAS